MREIDEGFTDYEVGGAVRDDLINQIHGTNFKIKDVDFAVEIDAPHLDVQEKFLALVARLVFQGFTIFEVTPDKFTVRALVPKGHPLRARTKVGDFVLTRKDGPYSDGRHPDFVLPGDLEDDLARRDATINAIARTVDGELIDPHGGIQDIKDKVLRFVGDPMQRITEDALRVPRMIRFEMTKGFLMTPETREAVFSEFAADHMKACTKKERIRDELEKMFFHSTIDTLNTLMFMPTHTQEAFFPEGLRLTPTMKKGFIHEDAEPSQEA